MSFRSYFSSDDGYPMVERMYDAGYLSTEEYEIAIDEVDHFGFVRSAQQVVNDDAFNG